MSKVGLSSTPTPNVFHLRTIVFVHMIGTFKALSTAYTIHSAIYQL